MSDLFAHGERTIFILPPAQYDEKDIVAEFREGINNQDNSPIESRFFSTHSIQSEEHDAVGNVVTHAGEEKSNLKLISNQRYNYGMGLAVGGIGSTLQAKKGEKYKIVGNSGENGHVFIKMKSAPGDARTCGMLMVGVENSGPQQRNWLGVKHGADGSSKSMSAFMSDKSAPGAKYNGRFVNLSELNNDQLARNLKKFQKKYAALYMSAVKGDTASKEAMSQILNSLTGRKMSGEEIEKVQTVLNNALRTDVKDGENLQEALKQAAAKRTKTSDDLARAAAAAEAGDDYRDRRLVRISQRLMKAEKSFWHLDKTDSGEMTAVKDSLKLLLENEAIYEPDSITNEEEQAAHDAREKKTVESLQKLYNACRRYMDPSLNKTDNERMKCVKALLSYTNDCAKEHNLQLAEEKIQAENNIGGEKIEIKI